MYGSAQPPTAVRVRPLAPYEPLAQTGRRPPYDPDQLALPLCWHPAATDEQVCPPSPDAAVAPPPRVAELNSLITALLECSAGHRPLAQLRSKLAPALYERMRQPAWLSLSGSFELGQPRHCAPHPRALEVCVTVHQRHPKRAFALAARWEANWTGWRCVALDAVAPGARTKVRTPAA